MMDELLSDLIAKKFEFQDPRVPARFRASGVPSRRMDSPVYRCCLEAICRSRPVRRFLEIGVKRGGSLEIVLQHTRDLESVVLVDFWTINAKKRAEQLEVEQIVWNYRERHPRLEVLFKDGSSTKTLASVEQQFDLIGIDGSHRRDVFRSDLLRCLDLLTDGGEIVLDDLVLHEDAKLDQELLGILRRNVNGAALRFRDVRHWPGAAIVNKRALELLDIVAQRMQEGSTLSSDDPSLRHVTDEEVAATLTRLREAQDWQAIDHLLAVAFARNSARIQEALLSILRRQSLELNNSSIAEHLRRSTNSPELVEELAAMQIVNGLDWVGQDRRVRVASLDGLRPRADHDLSAAR